MQKILKKAEKSYVQSKERKRKLFWCSGKVYNEGMILPSLPPEPICTCCLTPDDVSAIPISSEQYTFMNSAIYSH